MKILKIVGVLVIILVILYFTYSYLFTEKKQEAPPAQGNRTVSAVKDSITGQEITYGTVAGRPGDRFRLYTQ